MTREAADTEQRAREGLKAGERLVDSQLTAESLTTRLPSDAILMIKILDDDWTTDEENSSIEILRRALKP